jgi:chromosomal replication initiator protein
MMDEFRKKYRSLDYLLFDDVQFLANKTETQTELFNTFEALYNAGKQIVFTSDRPPKDLGDIPDRLISRFSWGLIADIQPPEYETRLAILENKAILEDLDIKDPDLHDALDLIAQSIQNNIRELESAFTRVLTFSRLSNARITKSFAKEVLSEIYDTKARDVGPDDIKKAVASYFSIKVSDLESPARVRSIAYPRHIAIYLVRNMLGYSLPDTGKQFGDRDHTTVMNSLKKIQADLMKNKELQSTIDKIKQSLE